MTNTKSLLIANILDRGTETIVPGKSELKKILESDNILNIYLGIDPTATHIHLGHAVPLRKLQHFAELGHNVCFLIGDFTAIVGDTSDKNSERPILTTKEIEQNFQTYKKQASKIVDFSKVKVVHNSDWLLSLNFSDLLQLTSHFSVNDFISRELIKNRLVEGRRVSLSEVLYPIMQGYDSLYLNTDVQLGGTDQIFNMQAGRTLIKKLKEKESFVLTNGFLAGTDGRKMSKSWGNAIWLDDAPEDMFGKIMSLNDDLIFDYFSLATSFTSDEIDKIKESSENDNNPLQLKKKLATRIVTELYDQRAAEQAAKHFVSAIQEKKAPEDTAVLEVSTRILNISNLIEHLCHQMLVESKSGARRLLKQNALYLNDVTIDANAEAIELATGENNLRIGKRKYLKILVK